MTDETKPRTWTLSRYADGLVCKAIGDFEKSSAAERCAGPAERRFVNEHD